jgi:TAG lipase/steryl ester hydrolase/phospholipase A2/LPA acyltransferase
MMPSPRRRFDTRALHEVYAALDAAATSAEWDEIALEHDRLTGLDAWRADDDSACFDAALLRSEIAEMARLREAEDGLPLTRLLTESLYRHLADLSAPELYAWALSGTKHIVTDFLDEVEACLRWLAVTPVRGVSAGEKRARFEEAWKVYGRSALMLSGGATWGFFHLGVIKALFDAGLLPQVLSGSSTGAMVAAGVGTRDDAALRALFEDTDRIRLDGLLPVGVRGALRQGAWLDPARLRDVLRHNCGDFTFAEAHGRSGRVLNISVSPTRTRQKPRVLSHLTAPEVLVTSAALASSALPGLFPPVVLEQRGKAGGIEPYVPSERWVDGSIYSDLPKLRLARLHNVNHFIVSQTNPHVVPFVRHHGQRGVMPTLAGLSASALRTQGAWVAELASRATRRSRGPVGQLADHAQALVSQEYRGDIDIHPRFRPELLAKVAVNPTREDLGVFIREGERATWPKLAMVRNQTRIGRVFCDCVEALRRPAAVP